MGYYSAYLLPAGCVVTQGQHYHLSWSRPRQLPPVWPQCGHENMLHYGAVEKHWISSSRLWLCLTSAAHHGTSRRPLSSGGRVSRCNTGMSSPTTQGDMQISERKSFVFCLHLYLLPKIFAWLCAKKETYAEILAIGRKGPMLRRRKMRNNYSHTCSGQNGRQTFRSSDGRENEPWVYLVLVSLLRGKPGDHDILISL